MQYKADRTTISLDGELMQAAQRFAENEGRTFSGLIATLLRAHLAANGALPAPDDAERQSVIDGLLERYSLPELKALRDQRTVAEAVGGAEQ